MQFSAEWPILKTLRETLCQFFDDRFRRQNQPSYSSFQEFQQFAYNKQLRFCLKILRRVKCEQDLRCLTHWDCNSLEVKDLVLNEMLPKGERKGVQPAGYERIASVGPEQR
jgi:hypothetical protein